MKDLPSVEIILEKIERRYQTVQPINFYEQYDSEKYSELLILCKEDLERSHQTFPNYRHKKF